MPTVPKDLRKSNKLRLIALIFFLYISFFTAITKIKTCFFLHLSFYKHNFNFETDIFILVNKHNSSIVVKINLAKASFNLNLALNTWESPFKSRFRNYMSSVTPPPPPPIGIKRIVRSYASYWDLENIKTYEKYSESYWCIPPGVNFF